MKFKGVLPVAEFETKFLPKTKAQPKEMKPITDKPIIQYAVKDSIDTGIIDDISLTAGKEKRVLEDVLREKGKETETILEELKKELKGSIKKEDGKNCTYEFNGKRYDIEEDFKIYEKFKYRVLKFKQ